MPKINDSTECIGDYFLVNSAPKPARQFNIKYLTEENSIYEVFRIHDGIPLFFQEHIERLLNSLNASNLKFDISKTTIIEDTKKLISINSFKEANIKLLLNISDESSNFVLYFDNAKLPTADDCKLGIKVGLYDAERIAPNIKYINMELRSNANSEMSTSGLYELLLVKDHKYITEGSRSNVFFIKGDKVFTPPLQYVLPGITRDKVIQDCHDLKYELIEQEITIKELSNFDSGFITGTSPKVLAIRSIDEINYKVNNSVCNAIAKRYDEIVDADLLQMYNKWR